VPAQTVPSAAKGCHNDGSISSQVTVAYVLDRGTKTDAPLN
jgi:hypothetical protein